MHMIDTTRAPLRALVTSLGLAALLGVMALSSIPASASAVPPYQNLTRAPTATPCVTSCGLPNHR